MADNASLNNNKIHHNSTTNLHRLMVILVIIKSNKNYDERKTSIITPKNILLGLNDSS